MKDGCTSINLARKEKKSTRQTYFWDGSDRMNARLEIWCLPCGWWSALCGWRANLCRYHNWRRDCKLWNILKMALTVLCINKIHDLCQRSKYAKFLCRHLVWPRKCIEFSKEPSEDYLSPLYQQPVISPALNPRPCLVSNLMWTVNSREHQHHSFDLRGCAPFYFFYFLILLRYVTTHIAALGKDLLCLQLQL